MNLLINEPPLQVLPTLAEAIGLNEAIFLQQLHYWLQRSNNWRDGRKWCYKSTEDWTKEFPFWSSRTIKRITTSLKKQNLIVVGNYNKAGFDRTTWYSIDYNALQLVAHSRGTGCPNGEGQVGTTRGTGCPNGEGQVDPTNTIEYTETTTEITQEKYKGEQAHRRDSSSCSKEVKEIIGYWNERYNKQFRTTTQSTKSKVSARLREGFTVEDFKKVIDYKNKEWQGTEYAKYLVPDTLFGTKFEKYLTQATDNSANCTGIDRYMLTREDDYGL